MEEFGKSLQEMLKVPMVKFEDAVAMQAQANQMFVDGNRDLIAAMNSFPRELTIKREGNINVIFNGAEAFTKMKPEIEKIILEKLEERIRQERARIVDFPP